MSTFEENDIVLNGCTGSVAMEVSVRLDFINNKR